MEIVNALRVFTMPTRGVAESKTLFWPHLLSQLHFYDLLAEEINKWAISTSDTEHFNWGKVL